MTRMASWLLCAAAVLPACSAEEVTEVLIRVDAEPGVASIARSVRVRVWGGAEGFSEEPTSEHTVELLRDAGTLRMPGTIPIVPPPGSTVPRRLLAEMTLIDGTGAEIAWARVTGSYTSGEIRETFVCFEDRCLANACGTTDPCVADAGCETCKAGTCGPAETTFVTLGEAPVRCGAAPTCMPGSGTETTETRCGNDMDDDCDGAADCLDDDCAGMSCGVGDGVCGGETSATACHDGADDDCDGQIDCEDTDCRVSLPPENGRADPNLCKNGVDDDCNGAVDCGDAGCGIFMREVGGYCANGVDDDGDGAVDNWDIDCLGAPAGPPGVIWCEAAQGSGLPLVGRDAQNDPDNCGACYLFCRDRRNTAGTSAPRACTGGHCVCIFNPSSPDVNGCTGGNFACNSDHLCRCTNNTACWSPNTFCGEMGGTGGRCVYQEPAVTAVLCR